MKKTEKEKNDQKKVKMNRRQKYNRTQEFQPKNSKIEPRACLERSKREKEVAATGGQVKKRREMINPDRLKSSN